MTSAETPTPTQISPATRRTILLLSFGTFSSMCAQRICDAMLPELSRTFAVSLSQAAQVVSVFAITYGISQLFYGPMGDRLGKFRVVTYAALSCCIGSVLAALATSLDALVFARLITSLGAAALIPLAMAWVGDNVPTDQLQEMLTRTGLGSTLGLMGGQLVGGLLTDALGWRWAFGFMTVLFGVVGSLMYVDLRRQQALAKAVAKAAHVPAPETGELNPHLNPGLLDDAASTAHTSTAVRPGFVKQALIIITGPWSRVILLLSTIEGAVGFGALAMWASHLHGSLGLSLSVSGGIVALFGLGGMLYMATGRHLIRRLGQPRLVLLGGGVVGVCALVLAYTPHWAPALPASLLGGFGFFMFHNTMQTNATQMAPNARGTAVSLFSSFLFLGQSIGVVAAAALIGKIGTSAVVAMGGGCMALLGVVFASALRRRLGNAPTNG